MKLRYNTYGGETMLAVNGYYDGHNYITEDNVAVKTNQRVIITFLDEEFKPKKRNLKKYVGKISESDSNLVLEAVKECRKVDSDEW